MINAKRAKALRKTLRSVLGHLPKVLYTARPPTVRWLPDYDRPLRLDGHSQMRPYEVPGSVLVAQGTQRYAYLQAKKHPAAAR